MKTISVIIPFYQKEEGILRKAVLSILNQKNIDGIVVEIVIVDDESPIKANQDLLDLIVPPNFRITLLSQKNTGPGGARNYGISYAYDNPPDFIAFLDSDDEWLPEHISDGIKALGDDFDFYFCNFTHFTLEIDGFTDLKKNEIWQNKDYYNSFKGDGIVRYYNNEVFKALLKNYISHTSTIIYRFKDKKEYRFDDEIKHAGEDYLMWINLSYNTKCALSTRANVNCGRGINIYFSASNWDSLETINKYADISLFNLKLLTQFKSYDLVDYNIDTNFSKYSSAYIYLLLRGIIKGMKPDFNTLIKILVKKPFFALQIPFKFLNVAFNKNKFIDV